MGGNASQKSGLSSSQLCNNLAPSTALGRYEKSPSLGSIGTEGSTHPSTYHQQSTKTNSIYPLSSWASTGWDDQVVIGRKTTGPRVARDQASVNAARRAGESVDASKQGAINASHVGPDHQRIAKLDRVNEVAPPAKVNPSVSQAMKDVFWIALSMTQKDLAAKTNEKPTRHR
ncbi:hypothetical protein Pst134EA_029173 [Puccinia striiformis f. sp. tritici]|uniref:hypothetical protein n=1 Tax=Puccinia striiformis f. sp. tritici TaxID=168172 RepID=UPI00200740FF|nr:hypothetical protein Pst134EA_029173 [Puccinia striiformis f. sp. tritici]KAH9447133.1 hypothetical protein Pst134EA_029173 [Puccinia striiformis f. sp. tritici]